MYEVIHQATQRHRVLKTMLPNLASDAAMRERFRLEATIAADVQSEHIVEVFDAGFDESTGLPFLVMEYLRGENLATVLDEHGVLSYADTITLLRQAALALERTHAAGIVHRDIKPENLFVTRRDDDTLHVKLLDFGIAKIVAQSTDLNTTRSFGTPLYMAPEQVRGDGNIDGRADLYALGHIAYTLLVGQPFWKPEAENATSAYTLLMKVVAGTGESASTRSLAEGIALPAGFDAWFSRATHPLPDRRFESALELVEQLAQVLQVAMPRTAPSRSGLTREASPVALLSRAERPAEREPTRAVMVLGPRSASSTKRRLLLGLPVVLAGGAVAGWLVYSSSRAPSATATLPGTPEPQRSVAVPNGSAAPLPPPVTMPRTSVAPVGSAGSATPMSSDAPGAAGRAARPAGAIPRVRPRKSATEPPASPVPPPTDPSDLR